MKPPRLPEVTARVVAWHNRHPLARRIDATQVHSIGEVQLPFASATPWGGAAARQQAAPPPAAADTGAAPAPNTTTPTGPTLAEALAQRNARQQPAPAPATADEARADPLAVPPAADAVDLALAADGAVPSDDGDDGEAALLIPLLDGEAEADPVAATDGDAAADDVADVADVADIAQEAPAAPSADGADGADVADVAAAPDGTADSAAAVVDLALPDMTVTPAPAEVYPPPHGQVPASALARAVERRAAARGAAAELDAGGVDGDRHGDRHGDSQPQPAGAHPPGRWRRLVAALRLALTGRQHGMPALRAAFSQDFIWPLRPGQVARWAQRHGRPQPVAPADWPRRQVDADRTRLAALRQKGLAHDLPLHVLTAAIGIGDRRIRVLLGTDGSILGPRAYSRSRVGSAAVLLAVGLVGAGWTLRPLHGPDDAAPALAALAASAPGSAAMALAASAPGDSASASATGDPAHGTAHGTADNPENSTAQQAEAGSDADPAGDHAANAAASASAALQVAAGAAGSGATAQPAALGAQAQPQADIRPALSDETRSAARAEAARLRGEAPPAPPPPELLAGPVYAVVSAPTRQRQAAAGNLALMQAAASRLDGAVPDHGELLQSQGLWRAAWWPFTSLVDAERARVLLAGRGLKAEVVEF